MPARRKKLDEAQTSGRKRWTGFNPQNPLDFAQKKVRLPPPPPEKRRTILKLYGVLFLYIIQKNKFEARSTKYETILNDKNTNDQNNV